MILKPLWHRGLWRLRDSGDNQVQWGRIGSGPSVFSLLCHALWKLPASSLNTVLTQAGGQILTKSWGKCAHFLVGVNETPIQQAQSFSLFACAVYACFLLRYWEGRKLPSLTAIRRKPTSLTDFRQIGDSQARVRDVSADPHWPVWREAV